MSRSQCAELARRKPLAAEIGADKAGPVIAYLRAHPDAVAREGAAVAQRSRAIACGRASPLIAPATRIAPSELALWPPISTDSSRSRRRSARATRRSSRGSRATMGGLRAAIARRRARSPRSSGAIAEHPGLFGEAEAALAPDAASATSTFVGALDHPAPRRARGAADRRRDARLPEQGRAPRSAALGPYRLARARSSPASLTWWVATSLITISGAGRELTEGFGSLLAARSCCSSASGCTARRRPATGRPMSRRSWTTALSRGSAWFLFRSPSSPSIARCSRRSSSSPRWAREGNGGALVAGASPRRRSLLGLIAGAMLRFSAQAADREILRLQLGADRGAGGGARRQGRRRAPGSRADRGDARSPASRAASMLGIFPTARELAAQLRRSSLLALGFVVDHRRPARPGSPA